MSGRQVLLNLIDQDHAVAHDDAGKRDDAEDRDEAKRGLEQQQGCCSADQSERAGGQHHEGLAEVLQLNHQQQQE